MSIDTTLYIHKTVIAQIESATDTSGLTINELIIKLLMRAIKEYPSLYYKGTRRIKYQERDAKKRWEERHIRYTESEYEYVNDMKKLYKMSISNILAFAVRNFLKSEIYEIILTKTNKKYDNNLFSLYSIVQEVAESFICWKIYWEIPQNPFLLFPKVPL